MLRVIWKEISSAIRNPITIFILSVALSLAIFYGSNVFITDQTTPFAKALGGLATAILTAGTFGVLFEFVGKKRLMREVVVDALGQAKALDLGLSDIRLKVSEIDYSDEIKTSKLLIVGSRYSASLLDRYKDDIRERLLRGRKSIKVLHMKDASIFPSTRGVTMTPEQFFRGLERYDAGICKSVKIIQTDEKLCYNFVQTDSGIWIKLYFSAPQPDLPPAFFVKSGSALFSSLSRDISLLLSKGTVLPWTAN